MIRSYTTVGQSKALMEKGLDPKTCDMWFHPDFNYKNRPDFSQRCMVENIPCWSMARLLALLPHEIVVDAQSLKRKVFSFSVEKFEPWQYIVGYSCHNHVSGEIDVLFEESCEDSPLDGLVDCLLWVLEKGYLDIEIQKEIADEGTDD